MRKSFAGRLVQRLGLLQGEDDGGEVEADAFAFLAGIDAAQQQDRLVDAAFAQLDPLGQKGDTKGVHAQLLQFAADIHETVAVGIGLDDSQNFGSAGMDERMTLKL